MYTQKESIRAHTPSVQGDLGGPVVEGSRHEDFLGGAGPSEHRGSGLGGRALDFALQILLPGQELLDLLRRLSSERRHRWDGELTDFTGH